MVYATSLYPPLEALPDQNIHDFLFNSPVKPPLEDWTVYIDAVTDKRTSRRDFGERVRDGATALGSWISVGGLELGPYGEMVGILSHNCMDFSALLHSLFVLTVPFALLSAFSTPFEIAHALRTSKCTRLFVQPALLPGALQAAKEAGIPEDRIYILEGRVAGKTSYDDLIQLARKRKLPRVAVRRATKDTLAYLVFSSGTSGLPKAVMISHGNIMAIYRQMEISATVEPPPPPGTPLPIVLAFLPFYHSYALQLVCMRGIREPATFVVLPKWNLDLVIKVVSKYKINSLLLVPSAMHQILHNPKVRAVDFESVVRISCGAAHLPMELKKRINTVARNVPLIGEGFGMSECTVSAMRKPTPFAFGGKLKIPLEAVGILLPGQESRIVREDGSEADYNEAGELWLKGPNVALGYYGNEKATKETFLPDGWLRTGDRFIMDEHGNFFFVDRAKDTLKVSGAQVSPAEIENVLLAHPGGLITDTSVAGVSGGRTSDEKVPRAWVVLSEKGKTLGEAAVIKELQAWTEKNLSKYKWLRGGIEVVDEIPKNPTGKVLRRVLQERYEQSSRVPKAKL
ncbi:acetyl-CoA synthetase-like protein [Obba rivulosa]|uniref:Acetyl-CoA synthetase-like protein n=1 Tax=Obba rivulosa TaxID=1052685 RepID=A0A8E2DM88_9APHY|nr:acetyl-CoA synthetase-like protein [Obba rivulosa]